jgi:carbamoyltransferase
MEHKLKETGYILGISRGHNAGVCLLKDGKIVFAIEEERLSRVKYDGGPYAAMMLVKQYTDKIDYLVISHTQSIEETCGKVDFTGDNVYTGLARKLGLIDRKVPNLHQHPQVIDLSNQHHKIHAACAFYRSGFEEAVAVIIDGAGTSVDANFRNEPLKLWEVETIIDCNYNTPLKTVYKHYGCRSPIPVHFDPNVDSAVLGETGTHSVLISGHAGITKTYEAVTEYCGFQAIEAGKTMGLFPYGKENENIPKLFNSFGKFPLSNRNLIIPTYPNSAVVSTENYSELNNEFSCDDVTHLQNRRDLAWACQKETQEQALNLILSAVKLTGKQKVVLSGGYGLNCVANYHYLTKLRDEGIEIYCEPISNDGGTAIGVALLFYYMLGKPKVNLQRDIYLGPKYTYTNLEIESLAKDYGGIVTDCQHNDVVELLTKKNIVAMFQGRSENGPRALGNRSILFDPRFKDGKDFVNQVKRREYFRPFAGTILEEDVHDWFDLRGMQNSPHMMYAVNCQPGIEEKIPSIIHVDGTCRIQTVNRSENEHYYDLIKCFKDRTGTPILFNTSFNLGGEPLVETLEDALWTLSKSDIDYLYLPEYNKLVTVKNPQQ